MKRVLSLGAGVQSTTVALMSHYGIILGGGEQFLSPERRFDAAILSTTDLFS